jgi:muramoyltetrapeptide carboxypeptidase
MSDNIIKPNKLRAGDLVAIISPSNTVATRSEEVKKACSNFEAATGLKTVLAPNALASHYYSAGTKQMRLDDFHWALKNPDIKAIIFSVGGNTAIELLDGLDYGLVKKTRKVIAGISDATTILDAITAKTGLITFLGIEFLDYASQDMSYETQSILSSWFDGEVGDISPNSNWKDFDSLPTQYKGWNVIKPGKAIGRITGGNSSSTMQLRGTEYSQDLAGSILFLEGYKKAKKEIHQQLEQLKLWGILDLINGLVLGYYVGSDDLERIGNERTIRDIVLEVTEGYDIPIMQIGEVGHNVENLMLPIGAKIEVDTDNLILKVVDNVVE